MKNNNSSNQGNNDSRPNSPANNGAANYRTPSPMQVDESQQSNGPAGYDGTGGLPQEPRTTYRSPTPLTRDEIIRMNLEMERQKKRKERNDQSSNGEVGGSYESSNQSSRVIRPRVDPSPSDNNFAGIRGSSKIQVLIEKNAPLNQIISSNRLVPPPNVEHNYQHPPKNFIGQQPPQLRRENSIAIPRATQENSGLGDDYTSDFNIMRLKKRPKTDLNQNFSLLTKKLHEKVADVEEKAAAAAREAVAVAAAEAAREVAAAEAAREVAAAKAAREVAKAARDVAKAARDVAESVKEIEKAIASGVISEDSSQYWRISSPVNQEPLRTDLDGPIREVKSDDELNGTKEEESDIDKSILREEGGSEGSSDLTEEERIRKEIDEDHDLSPEEKMQIMQAIKLSRNDQKRGGGGSQGEGGGAQR